LFLSEKLSRRFLEDIYDCVTALFKPFPQGLVLRTQLFHELPKNRAVIHMSEVGNLMSADVEGNVKGCKREPPGKRKTSSA
jgi:hypothetical protein